jgi:hypothetical protein
MGSEMILILRISFDFHHTAYTDIYSLSNHPSNTNDDLLNDRTTTGHIDSPNKSSALG